MKNTLKIDFCSSVLEIISFNNLSGWSFLKKELLLYPPSDLDADLQIFYVSENSFLDYVKDEKYVLYQFKNSSVLISETDQICIFCLRPHKNFIYKIIQKIISNQFTTREEYIGQLFHEIVLPICNYHFDFSIPIHGSAFCYKGKTFLIGGKGGVGKTSIELEFCFNKKAKFITDDIAFIHKNKIYPNLNFPKIYRYNLLGRKKLEKRLIQKFSIFKLIHWYLYKTIFRTYPRVRINPFEYYQVDKERQIDYYLILEKNKRSKEISLTKLETSDAAKHSAEIMKSELKHFNFPETYFEKIRNEFSIASEFFEIYKVEIPESIKHKDYLEQFSKVIEKVLSKS